MNLDNKFIEVTSYGVYGVSVVLLIGVLLFARNVNGASAWFDIGPFKLQPAEFAKIGTAMALARYMSLYNFSWDNRQHVWAVSGIIGLPAVLILLANDTGTALVFSSFVFMLYREGLSAWFLILGSLVILFVVLALMFNAYYLLVFIIISLAAISWLYFFKRRMLVLHIVLAVAYSMLVLSVDFAMNYVLKPHQKNRINAIFNPNTDPLGVGWNINQSKIAIGSGGFMGKGFLEGTQTKFDFVPQQHTDFIFCTIGEEYGWVGSTILLVLFLVFLLQLMYISESAKTRYARVYGFSISSIFFFHIAVNIGMTIGIMPVIGIPLPFFSYGGSSLLAFSIMMFTLLNFHSNRNNILVNIRE